MFRDKTSQTLLLLATVLPEAMIETMLAPLLPFIVRTLSSDLPANQIEGQIGGRAGLMTAVFYFPLLLMNLVWGTLSDSIGRKPFLLVGLFFCGLTTFILGINTTSFTIALLCRFTAGVFGGNSTIAKGGLGEIHLDEAGRSWAYSTYGSLYALSGIVGPVIGGILVSSPTSNTSKNAQKYPYLTTCLFGAGLSALVCVVAHLFFCEPKELLYAHAREDSVVEEEGEDDSEGSKTVAKSGRKVPVLELLGEICTVKGGRQMFANLCEPVTPALMFSIILYVFIAFCSMSWVTILPLLFATDPKYGGLGFSPFDSSFAMTFSAFSELFFQSILGQRTVLALGLNRTFCLGMAVTIPATVLVGLLGGSTSTATWYSVMFCMILFGFINAMAYLSVIVMISDSVAPASLGAAHGLAATCAAVVRTFSPPLSGYAWSFASTTVQAPVVAFLPAQVAAVAAIGVAVWGAAQRPKRVQYAVVHHESYELE
ncbi:hypothetical protein CcCBS67573_g02430 [Chytriomyces confervae]|uniref:Major facilitator superfamily (MFS) profile domain-containing protein n=1 Tax=Chytriomyces confervae TaxID=246404 RepID=A0A507FLH8_9FUNG|nr:hypothetical protein CcCBS67573_g02430 [Chytriomyces confervae]